MDLYLDLKEINNYIFNDEEVRNSSVELTELQNLNEETGEYVTVQKTIREVKESNDMTNKQTIRYDMIKLFIDMLSDDEFDSSMNLAQRTIVNTMINYGLAKEIKK